MIDIWREDNSNKRQFTWHRKDKAQLVELIIF
jgi:hypothetical protein